MISNSEYQIDISDNELLFFKQSFSFTFFISETFFIHISLHTNTLQAILPQIKKVYFINMNITMLLKHLQMILLGNVISGKVITAKIVLILSMIFLISLHICPCQ
jgi:hypothetical protein